MRKVGLIIACLLFPSIAGAALRLDGEQAAEATVRGPAGLSITAKSSVVDLQDTGDTVTFTIPIDSFKTGISLRDEHMRKAVESEKFSDVKLVLKGSDLTRPKIDDVNYIDVEGNLTFHGVTKPVQVHYESVADCESHIGAKVKFSIDLREFGIVPPSYLGLTVKPKVDVVARVRLVDQP